MKKIIAIILAAACIFAFASCGDSGNNEKTLGEAVESFKQMYAISEPTKIITNHTTQIGNVTLIGEETLVTGTIDGKVATVYEYWYEELTSIDEGGGEIIYDVKNVISGSEEYLEGEGVRIDGGSWKKNGLNFAPSQGDIAINISESLIKDASFTETTLSFTVSAENVEEVFGEGTEIEGDVKVSISSDGAVITGIIIQYVVEGEINDDDITYPDLVISISTSYSYDLEVVSLIKK